jgi:hypothetical protein
VSRAVQLAHNSTVDIETYILDSERFCPFPHVGNVGNVHNKLATGISSERMQYTVILIEVNLYIYSTIYSVLFRGFCFHRL